MPKSSKPRKKHITKNPAQAVYTALITAGLRKAEAEIIANEYQQKPKKYLALSGSRRAARKRRDK